MFSKKFDTFVASINTRFAGLTRNLLNVAASTKNVSTGLASLLSTNKALVGTLGTFAASLVGAVVILDLFSSGLQVARAHWGGVNNAIVKSQGFLSQFSDRLQEFIAQRLPDAGIGLQNFLNSLDALGLGFLKLPTMITVALVLFKQAIRDKFNEVTEGIEEWLNNLLPFEADWSEWLGNLIEAMVEWGPGVLGKFIGLFRQIEEGMEAWQEVKDAETAWGKFYEVLEGIVEIALAGVPDIVKNIFVAAFNIGVEQGAKLLEFAGNLANSIRARLASAFSIVTGGGGGGGSRFGPLSTGQFTNLPPTITGAGLGGLSPDEIDLMNMGHGYIGRYGRVGHGNTGGQQRVVNIHGNVIGTETFEQVIETTGDYLHDLSFLDFNNPLYNPESLLRRIDVATA